MINIRYLRRKDLLTIERIPNNSQSGLLLRGKDGIMSFEAGQ
jgi:hypothetical protein